MNLRTEGMKNRFTKTTKLARKQTRNMVLMGKNSARIPPVIIASGIRAIVTVPTNPIILPIISSGTTDWMDERMNTLTTDSEIPAIKSRNDIK